MKEYDIKASHPSSRPQSQTRGSGAAIRTTRVEHQPIAPISEEDETTHSTMVETQLGEIVIEARLEEVQIEANVSD